MWFYSVVFLILLAFNSVAYYFNVSKAAYLVSLILLILVAAFRPDSCCADYYTYLDYYQNYVNLPFTFVEPTFYLISFLSELIFKGPAGLFLIYSLLGVGVKGFAIQKLTDFYPISLLLYFASFFLLHEMTQIRVGVASGFLLMSIPYIQEKKFKNFLLIMLVGCLFHYSLLIFVAFYFVNPNSFNKPFYIVAVVVLYIATLAGINFIYVLQLIKLGFLTDKIETYQLLLEQGMFGSISLINPLLYLRIIIMIFFIMNYEVLLEKNQYGVILTKIYAFSIFGFIAFSALPVLAGRVNQLLGVVEIVLVPFSVYIVKPKVLAVIFSVLFALMIMYKQLYYSDLMTGYF